MADIQEGHEHRGKPQKEGKPRIIIIIICKDDMRGEFGTYGENYVWDFWWGNLKQISTWKPQAYVRRIMLKGS